MSEKQWAEWWAERERINEAIEAAVQRILTAEYVPPFKFRSKDR